LVCAIGSWILLPVVLAIVALVLASQAKQAIAASGGTKSGEGLITATQVIAWVHLILVALFAIFIVAFAIGILLSN
jgi:preprotein translocase subunit SecG